MWDVFFYECPGCGRRFRLQVDPTGKHKSYVIKIGGRRVKKS